MFKFDDEIMEEDLKKWGLKSLLNLEFYAEGSNLQRRL